ncbi:MAG: hypothetical protein P8Q48_21800 [Paracoccaceae bacterium]|nr:hypothetical protein [Paracoccaceae bacterium]
MTVRSTVPMSDCCPSVTVNVKLSWPKKSGSGVKVKAPSGLTVTEPFLGALRQVERQIVAIAIGRRDSPGDHSVFVASHLPRGGGRRVIAIGDRDGDGLTIPNRPGVPDLNG